MLNLILNTITLFVFCFRNNYFITEKSDGTRYLLYVIEMIK